jgi:hypothetical protein
MMILIMFLFYLYTPFFILVHTRNHDVKRGHQEGYGFNVSYVFSWIKSNFNPQFFCSYVLTPTTKQDKFGGNIPVLPD